MSFKVELFLIGLFIIIMGGIVFWIFSSISNADSEITNPDKRYKLIERFNEETSTISNFKEVAKIDKEEIYKPHQAVTVNTKFISTENTDQIVSKFLENLRKNGWVLFDKRTSSGFLDYQHCKSKYRATLSVQKKSIISDKQNYHLFFGLDNNSKNNIPKVCIDK